MLDKGHQVIIVERYFTDLFSIKPVLELRYINAVTSYGLRYKLLRL
jgi:hypothetical protein